MPAKQGFPSLFYHTKLSPSFEPYQKRKERERLLCTPAHTHHQFFEVSDISRCAEKVMYLNDLVLMRGYVIVLENYYWKKQMDTNMQHVNKQRQKIEIYK